MTRILVVGDRPGPATDARRPLYPHTNVGAAAHLAALMGLSHEDYLRVTERVNAWHDGDKTLDRADAKHRMLRMFRKMIHKPEEPSLSIIMGAAAMSVCPSEYRELKFGETKVVNRHTALYIPHTSGRNRVWNDSAYKAQLETITRDLVRQYL